MLVNREEIVFDAELKRAALARGPLPVGDPAALVADAVATLAAARGGPVDEVDVTVHSAQGVEAALIAGGHFEVAKALVLRRTVLLPDGPPVLGSPRLIRRCGQVVRWNATKIEAAIRKSFLSLGADPSPAEVVADRVDERAHALGVAYVPIETVQDLVQEELVLGGHMRAAERYILYRAERAALRAGDTAEELRARIEFASIGLSLDASADELERELSRALRPGEDARQLVVLNAKALVERDSEYTRFAGRILLTYIYEETLGWDVVRDGIAGLAAAHRRALRPMLSHGVAIGRVDERLLDYDLETLAAALDPTADLDFDFLGIQTLYDRYLIVRQDRCRARAGSRRRSSSGCASRWASASAERSDREARVLDLYASYKSRRFCSSTPTLFNAGTLHSQLSSCYLYKVDDTLESIMRRGIAENAQFSKWAGGLGGSWTAVRGTGSHIEGTNGESQGVIPFLKLHNDQLVAVNQGGKPRRLRLRVPGVWHNDIERFPRAAPRHRRRAPPHARHEHGELDSRPVHEARRGARRSGRSSAPHEVPDLHELYGRAFEERYEEYERRAEAGEIFGERIPALDLWKQMLRDALRDRAPVDHVQGSVQRPQPAGSRGRDPLEQSLHGDHAEHQRRGDGRLQPRLDRARPAPDAETASIDHDEAARDDPHRRARARQRDRHQLLPDRGRRGPRTCATAPSASA